MLNVDEIKLLSQRLYTKKQIQNIIPCINDISLCDMKYARRHISHLRSKSHPAESRQITSSLFTVTSYFKKILIKGKRQVKSEEVISKKSSFLRMRRFWRREWDSNPRDVAVKRFSRPPRYDRFDIPAYSVLPRGLFRAIGLGKRRRGTPDPALS